MKSKIETSGVQHAENAMGNNVFLYKKKIGFQYVYVEEHRDGKHKSLAFKSFRKRETGSPSE